MVTRSQWIEAVCRAWHDEPCPRCGRGHDIFHIDEDGNVWAFCARHDIDYVVAREHWPARFDPDPDEANDLPF